jgi:hypothetical protein
MLRAESFAAPPDLFASNAERDDFDSTDWRLTDLGLIDLLAEAHHRRRRGVVRA